MPGAIPKIIHHVWVGPNPLPAEEAEWIQSWKDKHPDWEFKLWTNENLPELPDNCLQALDCCERYPAFQADIIRYVVLLRFGGLYLDTDMKCVLPVDRLLEDVDFVALNPGGEWICNGFIGCSPQHPVLSLAVKNIRPFEVRRGPRDSATVRFGPAYLTEQLKDYAGEVSDRFVYEDYPCDGVRILNADYWRRGSELCHFVHYARMSWSNPSSPDSREVYTTCPTCLRRSQVATEWTHNLVASMHQAFLSFKGKHKGESAILFATGPSLEDFSYELLPENPSVRVGTNSIIYRDDFELDYYWCGDRRTFDIPEQERYLKAILAKSGDMQVFCCTSVDGWVHPRSFTSEHARMMGAVECSQSVVSGEDAFASDLATMPVYNYSIVFPAMQFLLYTGVQKIYIVGCDCTLDPVLVEHWYFLAKFKDDKYPDVEIVSVNPRKLEGLFTDIE